MNIKTLKATDKLQNHVKEWLEEQAENYYNGIEGVIKDLMYGGCQSGMVTNLIYNNDTVEFYKQYRDEIDNLLKDTLEEYGYSCPAELFGNKWDKEDLFARDHFNQNRLAWFGFEETARNLCLEAGIEV